MSSSFPISPLGPANVGIYDSSLLKAQEASGGNAAVPCGGRTVLGVRLVPGGPRGVLGHPVPQGGGKPGGKIQAEEQTGLRGARDGGGVWGH